MAGFEFFISGFLATTDRCRDFALRADLYVRQDVTFFLSTNTREKLGQSDVHCPLHFHPFLSDHMADICITGRPSFHGQGEIFSAFFP